MDVLEYIEKRSVELSQLLAQRAFEQDKQAVDEIRGALMEFNAMKIAFTPTVEITVEDPEKDE